MPDFLKEEQKAKGVDQLAQFIRPPFVKIVQGASSKELKEEFGEGAVLLVPGNDLVITKDESFLFTPIFPYREFLLVNPLELRGQVKMVEARSFDQNSDIARRAFDPDRRNEPMLEPNGQPMLRNGKPIFRSYQDVRVFLVMIHHPAAEGRLCAMTFARGELRTADRLSTLISARQKSCFACVFEASVGVHQDRAGQNDWYGFDIDNPSEANPWVTGEQYHSYDRMHDLMETAYNERRLQVADDDEPTHAETGVTREPDGVVEEGAVF